MAYTRGMAVSTIDAHPQRAKILEMIAAGRPNAEIAKFAGLSSEAAVRAWRKRNLNLPASVKSPQSLSDLSSIRQKSLDPSTVARMYSREWFAEQALKHQQRIDAAVDRNLEPEGDAGAASSLLNASGKRLELAAKVLGVLNEAPQVAVNSLVMVSPETTQPSPARVIDAEYGELDVDPLLGQAE